MPVSRVTGEADDVQHVDPGGAYIYRLGERRWCIGPDLYGEACTAGLSRWRSMSKCRCDATGLVLRKTSGPI